MKNVYYHGTNKEISEFIIPENSKNIKSPLGVLGIYFTKCPKLASNFSKVCWHNEKSKYKKGANVIPVYLEINNPLELSAQEFLKLGGLSDKYLKEYRDNCIKEGYDAIIFKKPQKQDFCYNTLIEEFPTDQYVVFNNSQIKSIFVRR